MDFKFILNFLPNLKKENLDKAVNDIENSFNNLNSSGSTMNQNFDNINAGIKNFGGKIQSVGATLGANSTKFVMMGQAISQLAQNLQQFTAPFIEYNAGMQDFSALTGVTGAALEQFGTQARQLATTFGGSVNSQIAAFKGILGKLGPDLARSPVALNDMAIAVNTLSKASGLDATASMEALATAMLQYGVSLSDPIQASKTMTEMMNVMAAGAKEGASEIPQTAAALERAGGAMKSANVAFAEGNAAIQTLAGASLYGSEAGTALRNVLSSLQKSTGPAQAELKKMGISSEELGEVLTSQGLTPALKLLEKGLNSYGSVAQRNAAIIQVFGKENQLAAAQLIRNNAAVGDLTGKISGTNTASEQAATNMNTVAAALDRFKAGMENTMISVFSTIGTGATTAIGAITQLTPVLTSMTSIQALIPEGAFDGLNKIPAKINAILPSVQKFSENFKNSLSSIPVNLTNALKNIPKNLNDTLKSTVSFAKNMQKNFTSIIPTITGLGKSIFSIIPAFTAAGVAGAGSGLATASAWFTALSPFLLVAAAIGGVAAVLYLMYQRVEGFRNIINQVFEVFAYIGERGSEVFSILGDIVASIGSIIFTYAIAPFKILYGMIESIIAPMLNFSSSATIASSAISVLGTAFDYVVKGLNFVLSGFKAFQAGLDIIIGAMGGVITKVMQGDLVGAALELAKGGAKAGTAFTNAFNNSIQTSAVETFAKNIQKDLDSGLEIKAKINTINSLPELLTGLDKLQGELKPLELKVKAGTATDEDKKNIESLQQEIQEKAAKINAIAPEASQGVKMWVNANGELKESYIINAQKATELANKNKGVYSSELINKQNDFSNKVLEISNIYQQQKNHLAELAQKLQTTNDPAAQKNLREEYNKTNKALAETSIQLKDGYEKGAKAGLLTANASSEIEKKLGLAKGTADQLKKAQEKNTAEAKATADAVEGIAEQYDSIKKSLNSEYETNIKNYNALKLKEKQGKKLSEDQKKQLVTLEGNLKNTSKQLQDINAVEKESEEKFKKTADITKKSNDTTKKQKESEYEKNTKIYDSLLKQNKQAAETASINEDIQRILQEREKTNIDEYNTVLNKINLLEKEKEEFDKIYKIQRDNQGNIIEVGIKTNKEEFNKILDSDIENTNKSLQLEANKLEIKSKISISEKELQSDIKKLNKENLLFEISLGLKKQEDFLPILQTEYNDIIAETNKFKARYEELNSFGVLNSTQQSELQTIAKKYQKQKELELSKLKEINTEKQKLYSEQEKQLEESNKKSLDRLNKTLEAQQLLIKTAIDTTLNVSTNNETNKYNSELKELENKKEQELLTEQEYNNKKEQLELDHQKKLQILKDMAAGAELVATKQKNNTVFQEQKKQTLASIALEKSKGDLADAGKLSALNANLQEAEAGIQENSLNLTSALTAMQTNITDIASSLFAGDAESVKQPFRSLFAALAGAIKQLASAAITKIVLEQLSITPGGIAALLLTPVIYGVVNAGVSAILDPLLEGLLSFSTGGRVDQPTLAVVGDAAQRPRNRNTEWITYDDQLKYIMELAINRANTKIMPEFQKFTNSLMNMLIANNIIPSSIKIQDADSNNNNINNELVRQLQLLNLNNINYNDAKELIHDFQRDNEYDSKLLNGTINDSEFEHAISNPAIRIKGKYIPKFFNDKLNTLNIKDINSIDRNVNIIEYVNKLDKNFSNLDKRFDELNHSIEHLRLRGVLMDSSDIAREMQRANNRK